MLILSRVANEAIIINGDITVRIVEITDNFQGKKCRPRVRIGITAPSGIRIDREEIHLERLDKKPEAE